MKRNEIKSCKGINCIKKRCNAKVHIFGFKLQTSPVHVFVYVRWGGGWVIEMHNIYPFSDPTDRVCYFSLARGTVSWKINGKRYPPCNTRGNKRQIIFATINHDVCSIFTLIVFSSSFTRGNKTALIILIYIYIFFFKNMYPQIVQ